jgi:hypothetical protein
MESQQRKIVRSLNDQVKQTAEKAPSQASQSELWSAYSALQRIEVRVHDIEKSTISDLGP